MSKLFHLSQTSVTPENTPWGNRDRSYVRGLYCLQPQYAMAGRPPLCNCPVQYFASRPHCAQYSFADFSPPCNSPIRLIRYCEVVSIVSSLLQVIIRVGPR